MPRPVKVGVKVRFRRPIRMGRQLLMEFSSLPVLGGACSRLAGLALGPYKDKRMLAYLTGRPYISPTAEIKCRQLKIGANCFVDDRVTIYCEDDDDGSVTFDSLVHIYRGTTIEVGAGGRGIIGSNTHIQGPCDLKGFLRSIVIGSQVQFAPYCAISSYNHAFDDLTRPIRLQGLVSRGDTIIEDDVWLGAGVKVLDGVRVGKGSVIGAGSVVTKDIPPYSVAVGVPAKVIAERGGKAEKIEEGLTA